MKNSPLSNVSIACSGFEGPEITELMQKIQKLGGKFDVNLKKSTTYLISNKINTDKCLTAANHGKKIMKKSWIEDLIKNKCNEIKEEKYYLGCFGGISFLLLGYRKEESQNIEKNIMAQDGLVVNCIDQAEMIILKNACITSEESKILEKYFNKTVTDKWYEECINDYKYIIPDNYLYTKESYKNLFEKLFKKYGDAKNDLIIENESPDIIFEKKIANNDEIEIKNLRKDLRSKSKNRSSSKLNSSNSISIPTFDIDKSSSNRIPIHLISVCKKDETQSSYHIFKKLIFYISDDYEKAIRDTIFKSISLGYGVVYNKISSLTTHVITPTNKDNFLNNAKFNRVSKPSIVNHHWIIDSLNLKTLLNCENYLPVSILEFENQKISHENSLNIRINSYIFKGKTFIIIKDSYSKDEYEEIFEKIKSNSGQIIVETMVIDKLKEKKASYIIINDASNRLSDIINKKETYQLVISHRYIDKCISDNKIICMEDTQFIHLLPLSYKIPLHDFSLLTIHFYQLKRNELIILEHVVELLGAQCNLSKKTTHIICNEITESQREKFKHKYNENILFVNSEWIIDCLINARHSKEDRYLI